MRILACDPGARPGYCLVENGIIVWAGWENPPAHGLDEFLCEDQYAATHIYRNGRRVRVSRKSQQSLSFTAGRLFERYPAERKYRIAPDAWRRILWPGAVRLTKVVVLARLRPEYGHLVEAFPKKHQPDVLEAVGIAVAWSRLSQEQKETYRAK